MTTKTFAHPIHVAAVAAIINHFDFNQTEVKYGVSYARITITKTYFNNLSGSYECRVVDNFTQTDYYVICVPDAAYDFGWHIVSQAMPLPANHFNPCDFYTPEIYAHIDAELQAAIDALKAQGK